MTTLEKIDSEIDHSCHPDSNLQHIRHMFEGYRDWVLHREECDSPYSRGSARDYSWSLGKKWAQDECK